MLSITFLISPVSVQQKGEWVQEESYRLRSNKFKNEEHLWKGNSWSGIAAVGFCLLCGTWVNPPYYWASTEWENWLRWPQSPHAAFWPLWCWAGSSDMCVRIAASQLWYALCGMWSRMKKLKSVSSCCVPNNSIIFFMLSFLSMVSTYPGITKVSKFLCCSDVKLPESCGRDWECEWTERSHLSAVCLHLSPNTTVT